MNETTSIIGWMSPDGYICSCGEHAHLDKARELVNYLKINKKDEEPDDTLLHHGWIRVSKVIYGDIGLTFWMPKTITSYQRMMLESIANEYFEQCSDKGKQTLIDYEIIYKE